MKKLSYTAHSFQIIDIVRKWHSLYHFFLIVLQQLFSITPNSDAFLVHLRPIKLFSFQLTIDFSTASLIKQIILVLQTHTHTICPLTVPHRGCWAVRMGGDLENLECAWGPRSNRPNVADRERGPPPRQWPATE